MFEKATTMTTDETWMKFVVLQIVHTDDSRRKIKYFDMRFFWIERKLKGGKKTQHQQITFLYSVDELLISFLATSSDGYQRPSYMVIQQNDEN